MASKQSTVDFLIEQMANAGEMRSKKMFGEFAIYCNEKVVAFVCDDQLFLKPTAAGKRLITNLEEAPAYPGSKMYYRISEDDWDDKEFLTELISQTANELPLPKPKKKKLI